MDTGYSCPFSQAHISNALLVLRVAACWSQVPFKSTPSGIPSWPSCALASQEMPAQFLACSSPQAKGATLANPESCDQWTHEKFNFLLSKWCTTDPVRLQSTVSDRKIAFIHRVLLQSENTKWDVIESNYTAQSTLNKLPCAGCWSWGLALCFRGSSAPTAAKPGRSPHRDPGLLLLALLESYSTATSATCITLQHESHEEDCTLTQKEVKFARCGTWLGSQHLFHLTSQVLYIKEMCYGKRLD